MKDNLPARRSAAPISVQRAEGIPFFDWGVMMMKSGFFGAKSPEEAMAKMAMGRDLGLSDTAALTGIHVIKGKPVLSSGAIASAVKRSGRYDYRVREKSRDRCVIEFFAVAGGERESLGVEEFTMQDARDAGVTGNPTWKRFPKAMLFARAITSGYRTHCPDVFDCSVYDAEELGADVAPDEYVILDDEHSSDPVTVEDVTDAEPRQPFETEAPRAAKPIRDTVERLRGDDPRKGGVRPRPDISKPEPEPVNAYQEAIAKMQGDDRFADPHETIGPKTPYARDREKWHGQTLEECHEWQGMIAGIVAKKGPPEGERAKAYARTAMKLRELRKAPTSTEPKGTASANLKRDKPDIETARKMLKAWASWFMLESGGDFGALAETVMRLAGQKVETLEDLDKIPGGVAVALAMDVENGKGNPQQAQGAA